MAITAAFCNGNGYTTGGASAPTEPPVSVFGGGGSVRVERQVSAVIVPAGVQAGAGVGALYFPASSLERTSHKRPSHSAQVLPMLPAAVAALGRVSARGDNTPPPTELSDDELGVILTYLAA